MCLLAYCPICAIGRAVLATALPTLIEQYATAPAHRVAVQTVFTGYTDGIYRGTWNLLEESLARIGWAGLGVLLLSECRRLGLATIVLGGACLVDSAGAGVDAVGSSG